ncbi:MAG: trypsin-like peptidase domain-containing protein [Nocardioides sp.]
MKIPQPKISCVTASIAAVALALPLSVAAVAPVAAATVLVDRGWPPYAGSPFSTASSLDTSVATDAVSAGLVNITSVIGYGRGEAAGTGMVIRSNGIVVTNHHVVEGSTSVQVTVVSTGRTYRARVLGYDATRDIAVLRLVGASDLETVATDSSGVSVGDDVTAVGDAGGDGGALTAAAGTVTDLRHPITVADESTGAARRLRSLIEIDADIIPGDSGGALLSSTGEVVGMNVAASSGSANITGYVIPVRRVLRIAGAVLDDDATVGAIHLGYDAFLGVSLSGSGTTLAGVLDGGAAADAGLAAGDSITSVGGTSVTTYAQLRRAVARYAAGAQVRVGWTDTAGTSHSATLTLGRAPVA